MMTLDFVSSIYSKTKISGIRYGYAKNQTPGLPDTGKAPIAAARVNPTLIMQSHFTLLLLAIYILLFAGCGVETGQDDRPVVSVSILPQKYFVERIAGDNFRVNVLVPPGASPETYEPTPGQIRDVANSLFYFSIGYIDFERTILNNVLSGNSGPVRINTSEGMDLIASEIVDHGDHVHLYGVDPHIWVSIPGAKVQVRNITAALIQADRKNKEFYLENFASFNDEIDALHASFTEKFGNAERNTFLVFHPSLGYFARDYQLEQIAVEQDGKSPTAANMRKIVDLASQEGIRDIFIQMEFERESAKAVARELGGDVIEIDPLSENWLKTMEELGEKMYAVLNN